MMMEKNYQINCSKTLSKYDYFVFLLIFSIVFGNAGGGFQFARILTVILFPYMVQLLYWCKFRYFTHLTFFAGIFFSYSLLSLIWSVDKFNGMFECLYNLIHLLFFLEIVVFSFFSQEKVKVLVWAWTISFMLSSVIAFGELVTNKHLIYNKFSSNLLYNAGNGTILLRRYASVTFGNFNTYVLFVCFCYPFLLLVLDYHPIVGIYCLLSSFTFVVFNASRGGIISLVFMSLCFFMIREKNKKIITILLFFLLFVVSLLVMTDCFDLAFARMSNGGYMKDDSRINVWNAAIKAFIESFGIGSGVGNLAVVIQKIKGSGVFAPHNLFVEFWLKYGIFISIYLIGLIIYILKNASWKNKKKRDFIFVVLVAFPFMAVINSFYLEAPSLYGYLASVYVVSRKWS